MAALLTNLRSAVITGFVFALILIFFLAQGSFDQTAFNMWLFKMATRFIRHYVGWNTLLF